jgi:hypothetical protein
VHEPYSRSLQQLSTFEPRRPHRRLRDASGVDWHVYECPRCAWEPDVMTLVFDSAGIMRRVCSYPADWHELRDDQLLGLSWRT